MGMEPLNGMNPILNPAKRIEELVSPVGLPDNTKTVLVQHSRRLFGDLSNRLFAKIGNCDPQGNLGVDDSRRRFLGISQLVDALSSARDSNQIVPDVNTQLEDLDPQDWLNDFVGFVSKLDRHELKNLIKELGLNLTELRSLFQDVDTSILLNRREFSLATGAVGVTALAKISLGSKLEVVQAETTVDRNAKNSTENNTESEDDHEHNPDHISKVDIISASIISTAFAGLIGGQVGGSLLKNHEGKVGDAAKKVEDWTTMGTRTNVLFASLWGFRVLALALDANGLLRNASEEEKIASQHALDHEAAEIINIPIALGLAGFSELTSHTYITKQWGEFDLQDVWNQLVQGEQIEIPINGNGNLKITYADFEEWLTIDVTNGDGVEEKRNMLRRIMEGGDELSHVHEQDVSAYLREYIADKRAEAKLDKYEVVLEEQRIIKRLIEQEIDSGELLIAINDPEHDNDDYLRLGQRIRKWMIDAEFHLPAGFFEDRTKFIEVDDTALDFYLVSRYEELDKLRREGIDLDIENLEKSLLDQVWKSVHMSMIFAPFTLTFTSASIVNNLSKRLAVQFYELHALKQIRARINEETDLVEEGHFDHEEAEKYALKIINGPAGLLNLYKTTAANINGGGLFGDPPNFFFMRYGLDEWAINSAVGIGISTATTLLQTRLFFKMSGIDLDTDMSFSGIPEIMKGAKAGLTSAGDTIRSIYRRITDPLFEKVQDNYSPESRERRLLDEYLTLDTESLTENLSGKVQELFYISDAKDIINGIKLYRKKNGVGNSIKELFKDDNEMSTKLEDMGRKIDELLDGRKFNSVEEFSEVFEQSFGFEMPDLVKSKAEAYINSQIKENGHHEHALSHSARDVKGALLTQLWVVGSLQTLAKKGLGLDQPGQLTLREGQKKLAAVLGIIAGASSVADNVAAMLFGIDILEKIAEKTIGKENYEQNPELGKALRRWGFLTSVAAGNLSKYGNGANFSIEFLEEIFRDDNENQLDARVRSMEMAESIINIWGPMAVAFYLAIGYGESVYKLTEIYNKLDEEGKLEEIH